MSRYFRSFSKTFQPIGEIELSEAKELLTYYEAQYDDEGELDYEAQYDDEGELVKLIKWLRQGNEWIVMWRRS